MIGVHAISIGNSLYIAKCLLQDPCERSPALVERVIGNLGKPGMAMLTSPATPRSREVGYDYSLVNHYPFDGSESNCFQHTTLHMSYTDWTLPSTLAPEASETLKTFTSKQQSVYLTMENG